MKFQPDSLPGTNTVSRQERGAVWINGVRWAESVLVPWRGGVQAWPLLNLPDVSAAHFESVLELKPELVIFGSGERLQFISAAFYRALIDARIGLETMTRQPLAERTTCSPAKAVRWSRPCWCRPRGEGKGRARALIIAGCACRCRLPPPPDAPHDASPQQSPAGI